MHYYVTSVYASPSKKRLRPTLLRRAMDAKHNANHPTQLWFRPPARRIITNGRTRVKSGTISHTLNIHLPLKLLINNNNNKVFFYSSFAQILASREPRQTIPPSSSTQLGSLTTHSGKTIHKAQLTETCFLRIQ